MIIFHRALISTGILFCIIVSLWELAAFRATGSVAAVVMAVAFALAALALAYYLKNLQRFLGR